MLTLINTFLRREVSRRRVALLVLAAGTLAFPFLCLGDWSIGAWQRVWHPALASSTWKFHHLLLLETAVTLQLLQWVVPGLKAPLRFQKLALKIGPRTFAVAWGLLLSAWAFLTLEVPGVPPFLLYLGVVTTEIVSVVCFVAIWHSGRPEAAGNALFLVVLPTLAFHTFYQLTPGLMDAYHHLTVTSLVESLRFLDGAGTEISLKPGTNIVRFSSKAMLIAKACSGVEGSILGILVVSFFLFSFRERFRWPRTLIVIPVGLALLWAGNLIRLIAFCFYGRFVSWNRAAETFHSNAGWIIFNLLMLGLLTSVFRMRWLSADNRENVAMETSFWKLPALGFLAPLIILLWVGLATGGLHTEKIDPWYALKIAAATLSLLVLWRPRLPEKLSVQWLPALGVGMIVFGIWVIAEMWTHRSGTKGFTVVNGLSLLVWAIGSSTIVPIVEELAFRGFLCRQLSTRGYFEGITYFSVTPLALVVSSLLFAVGHSQIIGGFLAGLAYGVLSKCTGNVINPIVAHATTNAFWAAFVIATKSWALL